MNVPTRLAAFAAVLALAFGGAALAGAAIDPTDAPPPAEHGDAGDSHGDGVPKDGGGPHEGGPAHDDAALHDGPSRVDGAPVPEEAPR